MSLRIVRSIWSVLALLGLSGAPITRTPARAAPPTGTLAVLGDLDRWDESTHEQRLAAAREVDALMPGFEFTSLETFGSDAGQHDTAFFVQESTGIEFALIPAGSFTEGSTPEPIWRGDPRSPGPPHRVTLSEAFLIARTEVTQAQFEKVMGSNPSHFLGTTHPVDSVTWLEAVDFCNRTGLALPTEAQWERACRAGTTDAYGLDSASSSLDEVAWTEANSGGTTHDVAALQPNGFGLFDVHGNVWEWMADALSPYAAADAVDPAGASGSNGMRVVRSGAWSHDPERAESSARCAGPEDERWPFFGFRPVAVVHQSAAPPA
jgi:formylglycine-generating enzyme required for sulfatase activity